MNRDEVKKMFQKIQMIYPNFAATTEIINLWTGLFKDADINKVSFRLNKHLLNSEFPPKPADLYAKKNKRDPELIRIEAHQKKVEEEGPIPQHLKDEMQLLIENLTKKMTNNDS